MTHASSPRGFTLIELLVVIAIIAILAAMLRPALSPSPCYGPSDVCRSNQKQIALSVLIYAADWKDKTPNLDELPGNDGPAALALLATDYLPTPRTFICPSVVKQRAQKRSTDEDPFVLPLDRAFFQSNGNDYAYYGGLLLNSPTNAMLADRFAWTNRSKNHARAHLNGKIVAAFIDGHAELLPPERIIGANYSPPWSAMHDPLLRPIGTRPR